MNVWTVITPDTVPHARLLAQAVRRHHPDAALRAVRLGAADAGDWDAEDLASIDERLVAVAEVFDWPEAAPLLRAMVLRHALDRAEDPVVVIDPHCAVLAPLDPVLEALESRSVALVPRVDGDFPDDGLRPGPAELDAAGQYDTALLAATPDAEGREFADWWAHRVGTLLERAREGWSDDPGVTEWLDFAPARFAAVTVLRDRGVGVSAWNLHTRPLAGDAGGVTAGGDRLRVLHFEAFDPRRPYWLSANAERVRVPDDRVLRELCRVRARDLLAEGWSPHTGIELGTRLGNGLLVDVRIARLFDRARLLGVAPGDPGDAEQADRFAAWMGGTAAYGRAAQVGRYAALVYEERADLGEAFPVLAGAGRTAYVEWLWERGRIEMDLPARLLPGLDAPAGDGTAADGDAAAGPGDEALPSVRVSGFFRGTLGLGAAARLYLDALRTLDVPVTTRTVAVPGGAAGTRPVTYAETEFEEVAGAADQADIDLICVNAEELPGFFAQIDPADRAARTIGVWAWETDHIPERWNQSFGLVDEIWVYTSFVAATLARISPVPIVTIPIPVRVPESVGAPPDLQIPDGFRFLFVFDFLSTTARKNPAGLIKAFSRAFAPGEGPQLVLKTLHADLRPAALDELRWLIGDRTDIHVVDQNMSVDERDALMASCDCYVSLHRAEGFGLTMAEAMALGKPVIGTGYSGNLDFMTTGNSYLVDYTMTRVGPDGELYPPSGLWAEPDLDHAAALMREVYEDPETGRRKGERARRDVEALLSAERVGEVIRRRLRAARRHRL